MSAGCLIFKGKLEATDTRLSVFMLGADDRTISERDPSIKLYIRKLRWDSISMYLGAQNI